MRVARCLRSSIRTGCCAPRPPACSCLPTSTPPVQQGSPRRPARQRRRLVPGRTDRTSRHQQAAREPLPGPAGRRAAPPPGLSARCCRRRPGRGVHDHQRRRRAHDEDAADGGTGGDDADRGKRDAPRPRRLQGVQGLASPVHPGGRARGPPRRAEGEELARAFGLRHARLPIRFADADGTAQWCARSSHCIGGPNSRTYPSVEPMAEYAFFTGGVGGETGRGSSGVPATRPTSSWMRTAWRRDGHARARGCRGCRRSMVAGIARARCLPQARSGLHRAAPGMLGLLAGLRDAGDPRDPAAHRRESFVAMLSLPAEWRRSNRMVTRASSCRGPSSSSSRSTPTATTAITVA